jgi:DNA-binding SARP family transcriptional activator
VVRIQLLGPVRAWRDGDELDLGGPKQQAVLALLAAGATDGHPVSPAELVDALWPERPPASAANVVPTYLKHLRRRLEPDRPPRTPGRLVRRTAGGYILDLSHVEIDAVRFRRLVAEAADADRAGDRHRAAERLGEALRLWHGTPLANVAALLSGHHPIVAALSGERWAAVARYGEAMLATGKAAEALPALAEAAAAYPLDEGVQARLIRAYLALGNRGQALTTYQRVRERLAEELGVDPGPELTAAYGALQPEEPGARRPVVPAQLPPATAMFTGRLEALRQLDTLRAAAEAADAVTITAITGTAGVGKTTLAVRWARHAADRFPDGQLFVNLRGFDPAGSVMSPGEAVRGFLDALQVPPERMPATLEAQVGMYRSLLAGRRMLIVLDNARDAAQVRPLLPGKPGCLVVVTSRDELTGLTTSDAAVPVRLDLLTAGEATELLTRRLGAGRTAAEPEALAGIVRRCAGLPLALAIVAARAAARPEFGLASLVEELREASIGLEPFAGGDPATDLRSVLSWSYRALTPAAARLFRQLAVHPGPDISAPAAASLAGVPVPQARPPLDELTRAHLLTEHSRGRYAFHDLLRTYATELASTVDGQPDRAETRRRALDHYLHSADTARRWLAPYREPIPLDPPHTAVTPEELADREQALAWLTVERPVLVGCLTLAAGPGLDARIWQLVHTVDYFLDLHGDWHDSIAAQSAALAAAERLGDQHMQARSHRRLSGIYGDVGEFDQARHHQDRARELSRAVGDRVGEAFTDYSAAFLLYRLDRHQDALATSHRALDLFRAAGHRVGEGLCLNAIGWIHAEAGEYEQALRYCQQALTIHAEIGDSHAAGITWDSVGYVHHNLGDFAQATDSYERALALHRRFGDRYHEGETLAHLGDTRHATGDLAAATDAWQQALSILDQHGHPETEVIRRKLRELTPDFAIDL